MVSLAADEILTVHGERSPGGDTADQVVGVADVNPFVVGRDSVDPEGFLVGELSPPDGHFTVVSSPQDFRAWVTSDCALEFNARVGHGRDVTGLLVEKRFH